MALNVTTSRVPMQLEEAEVKPIVAEKIWAEHAPGIGTKYLEVAPKVHMQNSLQGSAIGCLIPIFRVLTGLDSAFSSRKSPNTRHGANSGGQLAPQSGVRPLIAFRHIHSGFGWSGIV